MFGVIVSVLQKEKKHCSQFISAYSPKITWSTEVTYGECAKNIHVLWIIFDSVSLVATYLIWVLIAKLYY